MAWRVLLAALPSGSSGKKLSQHHRRLKDCEKMREDEKKVVENPRKLILKYYVSYLELLSCLFQVSSSSCLSSVANRGCRLLHDILGIAASITTGIVQNAYTQYCVFGSRICANRVSVHTQPLPYTASARFCCVPSSFK